MSFLCRLILYSITSSNYLYFNCVQNKNGFGIFSHSETHRQGEEEGDEYVEPTRRSDCRTTNDVIILLRCKLIYCFKFVTLYYLFI